MAPMEKSVLGMNEPEPKKALRADRLPAEGFVKLSTAILSQSLTQWSLLRPQAAS